MCCFRFAKRLSFLFLLFFIHFSVYGQVVVTLEAALDSTMKNNLQIRQADFRSALSDQDVFQSRMNLLPSLNGGLSSRINGGSFFDEKTGTLVNTINKSVDGSLNSSLVIFQGFQKTNQIAFNKYMLEADKSSADQLRYDLQISVFTTYIEALTNRELLEAAKEQVSLSESQFAIEEIQVGLGNKTLAGLSQAKSQIAMDEMNVTAAQNSYELSVLTLKQLMEMNPVEEIVLEYPKMRDMEVMSDYSPQEVYEYALMHFPEIQKTAFNTRAAEINLKIAKGNYIPTISLSTGIRSGYTSSYRDASGNDFPFRQQLRNNFSRYIGFSMDIPIFNNFSSRIGIKKAKISLDNTKVTELQARNSLNKIIHQAILDFRASKKHYIAAKQSFIATKEAYVVIKERYDVGLATAIELSTSQTQMNRAEFDFISSKYNVIFRNKVIDYYLGNSLYF